MFAKPITKTAAQLNIENLYHYQPFDPTSARDCDRLADILINHRVYCSDPACFNDPWDCQPHFDRQTYKAKLLSSMMSNRPRIPKEDRNTGRYLEQNELEELVDRYFMRDLVNSTFWFWSGRVYCLSPSPSHPLMWSHYTNKHNGLCLQFSVKDSKFQHAIKVDYRKSYPSLDVFDIHHRELAYRVKSDVWRYEQEFRLLCSTDNDALLFMEDTQHLSIEPHALTSIIVGCQADFSKVSTFIKDHAPNLKVTKAVRIPDRYDLEVEEIPS
jgi:hypothetical protein